ncbi:MAG: amino acid ABC transporter permease [Candidatus Delongbacteria bacterium]|nr:amino acid ABC transporter permease [Candidatus Delongbacteria bacterium]MBN2834455.1 amino acid ABC transporter permease [Candidatus Delongbacteria bacterium]
MKKLKVLDYIVFLFIIFIIVMFFIKMDSELSYSWDWKTLSQFFFKIDNNGNFSLNLIMKGFFATIRISIWSIFTALSIGVIGGYVKYSNTTFSSIINIYVDIIRNIPPIVIIFIFYFFVSSNFIEPLGIEELFNDSENAENILSFFFADIKDLDEFLTAVLALSIYEGAYMVEIIRSGLISIPKGQWDAAQSLGFNRFQILLKIIFPQVFRNILPAMTGQIISVVKDSAIVSVISIAELTFQGMEIMSSTYLTFELWITITLMYFVITFTISFISGRIEKNWKTIEKK